jgi:hypothetical protein
VSFQHGVEFRLTAIHTLPRSLSCRSFDGIGAVTSLRWLAALNSQEIARIFHANRRMIWGQGIALFGLAGFFGAHAFHGE